MSTPTLNFYYRQGCHLCEDMWQHLEELRPDLEFNLNPVDIDANPQLKEQFGQLIPVLQGGRETICNYYLDPVALEKYVRQHAGPVDEF